ncbi:N-acetylneuraminate synthase [Variovorax robiniae]|uniref:N-acetylneuraminate synthase n=1 Tax=Variovorax robiniae TaxID=1836199 RepID=A0ABU8XFH0_9BURK
MNSDRVFIIAEAGVNHNGSLALAMELADAALAVGADAVKFQSFRAADVVTPDARTAEYQLNNTGESNQFEMIKKLELSELDHQALALHCKKIGIEFFSTPFSEDALAMLLRIGVRRLKIPSGEITNKRLIVSAAKSGLPLLLSSGMSTMEEVSTAVGWVHEGRLMRPRQSDCPGNLVLLHCTSAYPAPPDSLNLRALQTMSDALLLPVGYSDHSEGTEAALAAVALGARVIEKHLTLDVNMPGPDHRASADPRTFAAMVRGVRLVEVMRGDGAKQPQPIERNTRDVARRSLVLNRNVRRGQIVEAQDLCLRRPGTGLPPEMWESLLGRRMKIDAAAHTLLTLEMLEIKE